MLAIKKEQLDVLNVYMRERFIEKTVRHIREVFAQQVNDKKTEELRVVVENGMRRASTFELDGEREVTLFIDLLIGLGQDFDSQAQYAGLKRILRDKEFSQRDKMELIYQKLERMERRR